MFSAIFTTYSNLGMASEKVKGAEGQAFNALLQEAISGYYPSEEEWIYSNKRQEQEECDRLTNSSEYDIVIPKKKNGEYVVSHAPWNRTSTYKTARAVIGKSIRYGISLTNEDGSGNGKGKTQLEKEYKAIESEERDKEEVLKGLIKTAKQYALKHDLGEMLVYLGGEEV